MELLDGSFPTSKAEGLLVPCTLAVISLDFVRVILLLVLQGDLSPLCCQLVPCPKVIWNFLGQAVLAQFLSEVVDQKAFWLPSQLPSQAAELPNVFSY